MAVAAVAYQSVTRFVLGINPRAAGVLLGVQLVLVAALWGFSVDDAWIVSRVASHGAQGLAFEFNLGQPSDAITPLGFAQLVAAVGKCWGTTQPLPLFAVARALGVAFALLSFVVVGLAVRERRWGVLLALGWSSWPSALWAGAGLETPLVGFLISLGCVVGAKSPAVAGWCLGLASAWRPELAPYCLAILVTVSAPARCSWTFARPIALMAVPHLLVMGTRFALYGSCVPLSFVAKAPDFASGVRYVLLCLVWGGLVPGALLMPGAFRRGAVGWAVVIQLLAMLVCGGDWMPGLRLCAPIYPSLVWGVTQITPARSALGRRWRWLLFALMPVMPAYLLFTQVQDLRNVVLRRLQLVEQAAPALEGAHTVAAVDVGWVGLSFPGRVLDLGGVTDPRLARIPWGHTHRRLGPGLFSDRNVDAWVIRAADRLYAVGQPLAEINPVYGTDARLLARSSDLGMVGVLTVPLLGTQGQYVIARLARSPRGTARPSAGLIDGPHR